MEVTFLWFRPCRPVTTYPISSRCSRMSIRKAGSSSQRHPAAGGSALDNSKGTKAGQSKVEISWSRIYSRSTFWSTIPWASETISLWANWKTILDIGKNQLILKASVIKFKKLSRFLESCNKISRVISYSTFTSGYTLQQPWVKKLMIMIFLVIIIKLSILVSYLRNQQ